MMKLSINDLQGEGCFGFHGVALLVLLGQKKKKKAAEESEQ